MAKYNHTLLHPQSYAVVNSIVVLYNKNNKYEKKKSSSSFFCVYTKSSNPINRYVTSQFVCNNNRHTFKPVKYVQRIQLMLPKLFINTKRLSRLLKRSTQRNERFAPLCFCVIGNQRQGLPSDSCHAVLRNTETWQLRVYKKMYTTLRRVYVRMWGKMSNSLC